jgi:RNA polymerase sigma-70 factor (sigma-E family)
MSRKARAERRDADFGDYLAARQPALLRTAYLLTGDRDQAEDLLQTSLAKLYLSWDRVQDRGAVDGYLRRIMVNERNSLWRRAWRRREISTDRLPEPALRDDRYDDGTHDELWQVVRSLPERARAVVVLRYYEQMTEPEVADALGISVGTVKSQCSRAMATLRQRVPSHLHPAHEEER